MGKGGCVRIERCKPGASGKDVIYLRRLHSYHPSNPFQKDDSICIRSVFHITFAQAIVGILLYHRNIGCGKQRSINFVQR